MDDEAGGSMGRESERNLVRRSRPDGVDAEALLPRVARGDSRAFAELYDAMGAQVYGLARRVVRDPSRAEDITQEAFLDVWCKAPRFDADRGSARTWMMTITHRRAVDAVRRNEVHRRADTQGGLLESSLDLGDRSLEEEQHAAVRACLDSLTALQLESVRLAYYDGHTYVEVARLLGKPSGTIKTRIRDALIRLRRCLEERDPDD